MTKTEFKSPEQHEKTRILTEETPLSQNKGCSANCVILRKILFSFEYYLKADREHLSITETISNCLRVTGNFSVFSNYSSYSFELSSSFIQFSSKMKLRKKKVTILFNLSISL